MLAAPAVLVRGQEPDARAEARIQEFAERARSAQASGDLQRAIEAYQGILRIRPGWGPVELNLGLMYQLQKNYNEALRFFNSALQHDATLAPAHLFRGIAYFNTAQYEKAYSALQTYLKLRPDDREVRFFLAGAEFARGNYFAAARRYLEQIRLQPERGELYYRLGESYLAIAREYAGKLESEPKGKYYLWLLSAEGHAQKGEREAAESALREAKKLDPTAPDSEAALAPVTKPCTARSAAMRARTTAGASLENASCQETQGDFEGATAALAAARSAPGFDARMIYLSSRVLMRLANRSIARLVALAPDSYLVAMMQGLVAEQGGSDTEAEREFGRAVASNPPDAQPWIEYARIKAKQNRFAEAIDPLQKALERDPYNPRAQALLGETYLNIEQAQAAIPHLERAVRANPADIQLRILLARSLSGSHQVVRAVSVLEAAPEDPEGRIQYVLAGFYRQLGRTADANRALANFEARRKKTN